MIISASMGQKFSIEKVDSFNNIFVEQNDLKVNEWFSKNRPLIDEEKMHIIYVSLINPECNIECFNNVLDKIDITTLIIKFNLNDYTKKSKIDEQYTQDYMNNPRIANTYYEKLKLFFDKVGRENIAFNIVFVEKNNIMFKLNDTKNYHIIIKNLLMAFQLCNRYTNCYKYMKDYISANISNEKIVYMNDNFSDELISSIFNNTDLLNHITIISLLINALCVNKTFYYKTFMYIRINFINHEKYANLFLQICKNYIERYQKGFKTDEFISFVNSFIPDIKYETLVCIDKKILFNTINSPIILASIIQQHTNKNNMDAIIKIFPYNNNYNNSNNHNSHSDNNINNIIIQHDWDEDDLTKYYKASTKKYTISIFKVAIKNKFYNLIKNIIKELMKNNMYDELSTVYNSLNTYFDIHVINLFVKFDFKFIPNHHLTEENFLKWHSAMNTFQSLSAPLQLPYAPTQASMQIHTDSHDIVEYQEEGQVSSV